MTSAGAITQKIRKQLHDNEMGALTVRTTRCANNVWLTNVFLGDSGFTALDVFFAFQGWKFEKVSDNSDFVSLVSPEAGI